MQKKKHKTQDATQDDLHQAGMKQGHVRRVFRALRAQQGAPNSATAARAGVVYTTTTENCCSDHNNSSDTRVPPPAVPSTSSSSGIFVPPTTTNNRRSCVVMYEDGKGRRQRFVAHLGGAAAAGGDGSAGCPAAVSVDEAATPRGAEGAAGNLDGFSAASSFARSHDGDLDPADEVSLYYYHTLALVF